MNDKVIDLFTIAQEFLENHAENYETRIFDADDGQTNLTVEEAKKEVLSALAEDIEVLQNLRKEIETTSYKKLKEKYL